MLHRRPPSGKLGSLTIQVAILLAVLCEDSLQRSSPRLPPRSPILRAMDSPIRLSIHSVAVARNVSYFLQVNGTVSLKQENASHAACALHAERFSSLSAVSHFRSSGAQWAEYADLSGPPADEFRSQGKGAQTRTMFQLVAAFWDAFVRPGLHQNRHLSRPNRCEKLVSFCPRAFLHLGREARSTREKAVSAPQQAPQVRLKPLGLE